MQTPDLALPALLTQGAQTLAALPNVHSLALWTLAADGDALLELRFGAGQPRARWEAAHPLRRDFGRRPFLLDEGAKPAYASLGLDGRTVVIFDLGKGHYCGLGLDLPHDGSAGLAVKALRPAVATWMRAIKDCYARATPAPKKRRATAPSAWAGPQVFPPLAA